MSNNNKKSKIIIMESTMPMNMEGTMPLIMEGTPPLRGQPYPTL